MKLSSITLVAAIWAGRYEYRDFDGKENIGEYYIYGNECSAAEADRWLNFNHYSSSIDVKDCPVMVAIMKKLIEGRKVEFVHDLQDIQENIQTIDKYLQDEEFKDFAIGLIKRGTCFIAVKKDQRYCFYPSRFIGYKNNNQHAHIHNSDKDGRYTNPAISSILGCKPMPSEELEIEYKRFCDALGFLASAKGSFGVKRKYWVKS